METPENTAPTHSIVEYSATEAGLADLAHRFKGVVFDVTTPKGMTEAKEARKEIRTIRIKLDEVREEIKAPVIARGKLIDTEAKRIKDALLELETPIADAIKAEEQRAATVEAARIADLQARLDQIKGMPATMVGKTAVQITEGIETLRTIAVDESWAEFQDAATLAKANALLTLQDLHKTVQGQEEAAAKAAADAAELNRLREAAAAEERKKAEEREAENKRQAEINAKAAAELAERQAAIDAAEKESRDRIAKQEAEAKAKADAIAQSLAESQRKAEAKAKKDREAAEAKAKAEREEREAKERAERLAEEERQRKIRLAEAARQDAYTVMEKFKERFGAMTEFAGVVAEMDKLLIKAGAQETAEA